MNAAVSTEPRNADLGLLLLRIALGAVIFYAGYIKLIVMGPEAVTGFFAAEGIPLAGFFAWAITLLEFVGGACLVLGLLTRPIAALLSINMVVAFLLVSIEIGFMSPDGHSGAEVNLLLIGGFLALLFAGPGSISLDSKLEGGK